MLSRSLIIVFCFYMTRIGLAADTDLDNPARLARAERDLEQYEPTGGEPLRNMEKRRWYNPYGSSFAEKRYRYFDSLASGIVGKRSDTDLVENTMSDLPEKRYYMMDSLASGLVGKRRLPFDSLASGLVGKRRLPFDSLASSLVGKRRMPFDSLATGLVGKRRLPFDSLATGLIGKRQAYFNEDADLLDSSETKRTLDTLASGLIGPGERMGRYR